MRTFLKLTFALILIPSLAFAQTEAAPTAFTPVTAQPPAATPATQPAPAKDPMQMLSKFMSSKQGQQNLGPALAGGVLLNCTQKQTGREAAQAFYNKMQTVSKTVEADCKQGNAPAAKTLALQTIDQNANDPVAKAALNCYDSQRASVEGMAGPEWSAKTARYAVWVRDPAAAHREMTEAEICNHKKNQGVN